MHNDAGMMSVVSRRTRGVMSGRTNKWSDFILHDVASKNSATSRKIKSN